MEQLREPGLSPKTREWLKNLQMTQKAPVTKKRAITKGNEWLNEMPDHIAVRRPHSQCSNHPSAEQHSRCICHRPKTLLHCYKCGFKMYGRVRRVCLDHTRTMFLMDISQCPKCLTVDKMVEENDETFTN